MRMPQLLYRPPEHHTFCPLTMHRSPSRSARVVSDARSLPAPGSENSWHHTCSAASVARRWAACCSGVPNRWIAARQHEADHVEERRYAGPRAFQHPHPVVFGGQAPSRRARRASGCPRSRPRGCGAARRARHRPDRAGRSRRSRRGARTVLGQPGRHLELEVVDGDHPAKVTRPRTPRASGLDRPERGPVTPGGAPRGSTTASRGRAATGRRQVSGRTATDRTAGRGGSPRPRRTGHRPA